MNDAAVLLGVLAISTIFGLWRRHNDGRVRAVATNVDAPAAQVEGEVQSPFRAFGELGSRATIVQFSARVCAPCRAAKTIAGEIAAAVPGVTHIDIDAEGNLDLVAEHRIMRTPTLLVLDGAGRVSARIVGVPRRDELLIAIDDRRYEDI